MKAFVVFVCSVLAIGLVLGCKTDPPLDVAEVELSRFEGKWYEIARLPRPTQRGCENTTAHYRLKSDSELDVTNECVRDGATTRVTARAVVTDPDVPGKLSIDVGAFYGDYWIVEVGGDYEYAVIGHPTRDYLWILSRTPTLDDAALRGVLDRVSERHFDVSRLEYTKQDAHPGNEAAAPASEESPREYGCALASGRFAAASGWSSLVLVLASVLAARGRVVGSRRARVDGQDAVEAAAPRRRHGKPGVRRAARAARPRVP